MDELDRSAKIRSYLKIEPISHGQIHTLQIAIPREENWEISPERYTILEDSLTAYQSNLIPLIVRRTDAYGELQQYEVIHGSDWLRVAQTLNIQRLWVWVFDLTDDQVGIAKREMEGLLDYPSMSHIPLINSPLIHSPIIGEVKGLMEQLQHNFDGKINQLSAQIQDFSNMEVKVDQLTQQVEELSSLLSSSLKQIRDASPPSLTQATSSDNIGYKSQTVSQLKELCKKRGIKVKSGLKKDDIIALLVNDDQKHPQKSEES